MASASDRSWTTEVDHSLMANANIELDQMDPSMAAKDEPITSNFDMEAGDMGEAHLMNTTIRNFSWRGVCVTVKDRETKQPKLIVDNLEGIVEAGEICALMGPSGCGKTTLLNMLASRPTGAQKVEGKVLVNGAKPSRDAFREMSCFVEQEDALIGSLTVKETLWFASRLASTSSLPKRERLRRIDGLIDAFGLRGQADTVIGTPLKKGISGGQKRRVGVASQLITSPRILFLDEPTSGLDSAASWEVVNFLKGVAKRNNLIVIASIHQPSSSTFQLFDKLCLMSQGKPHYFGSVADVPYHFQSLGLRVPMHTNPAEWLLELVNVDFSSTQGSGGYGGVDAQQRLDEWQAAWATSQRAKDVTARIHHVESRVALAGATPGVEAAHPEKKPSPPSIVLTLLHRSFVKSYRDVVAYGIRFAMYFGLALMMGTVWWRLPAEQSYIQPMINAIFYGSAFMSFMAVAYVPAYIEDHHQYVKEHHNGLYGAAELILSNFLIGIPYLFLISLMFSIISYWLSNFQPTGQAFFTWVFWIWMDLLAAESLVVFFTSLFPSFVVSLALVAFANGLWMSVNGFMIQPTIMNSFYKYVFHFWDYQKYVFEGMMVNEFGSRNYACGAGCQCQYVTELADQCMIAGQGVLDQYGYAKGYMGTHVGIMIAIIAGYRLAAWLVLYLKK